MPKNVATSQIATYRIPLFIYRFWCIADITWHSFPTYVSIHDSRKNKENKQKWGIKVKYWRMGLLLQVTLKIASLTISDLQTSKETVLHLFHLDLYNNLTL